MGFFIASSRSARCCAASLVDQGPRLVMEDATGDRDDVSAERLLKALRDGRAMPRLLVLSSCHSAEQRTDLAAE